MMYRVLICIALLSIWPGAGAEEHGSAVTLSADRQDILLVVGNGRVRWQLEALDLLPLPEFEPFDGIPLGADIPLALELSGRPTDLDGQRRVLLSVTVGW